MRMTSKRKDVLNIISATTTPLSAEMIYDKLNKELNLSTVYRILDFFILEDVILKMVINNVSYYYLKTNHHHHYFICTKCGKMIAVECGLVSDSALTKQGYLVEKHDLTIYGLCPECIAR